MGETSTKSPRQPSLTGDVEVEGVANGAGLHVEAGRGGATDVGRLKLGDEVRRVKAAVVGDDDRELRGGGERHG